MVVHAMLALTTTLLLVATQAASAAAALLLQPEWSNAALLEPIFAPPTTTLDPRGSFLYTTTAASSQTPRSICLWGATSNNIVASKRRWNATFAELDQMFAQVVDLSALDGVIGTAATTTAGAGSLSSVFLPNVLLDPVTLCMVRSPGLLNASCEAVFASTALDCLLDPSAAVSLMESLAGGPFQSSSQNLQASSQRPALSALNEYVSVVLSSRAIFRRWFVASLDFTANARAAYDAIAIAQAASVLTAPEKNEVLQTTATAFAAFLSSHMSSVIMPKWAAIDDLLRNARLSVECPTTFLAAWKAASSVSMGTSIVESGLATAVALLLAATTADQFQDRAQCVLATYAVGRWLEEDLPSMVVTAQFTPSMWTASTLAVLANAPLSVSYRRLAQIMTTRLTLATLSDVVRLASLDGAIDGTVVACVTEWFVQIAADAPSESWLRRSDALSLSRCFVSAAGVATAAAERRIRISFTDPTRLTVLSQAAGGGAAATAADTPSAVRLRVSPNVAYAGWSESFGLDVVVDAISAAELLAVPPAGTGVALGSSSFLFVPPTPSTTLRQVPVATTTATPVQYTWNASRNGTGTPSCGPGFVLLRDYDTNETICRQCLHDAPSFLYCTGDGYARACTNKPLENASYLPQGVGWASPQCPFVCLHPFQYRAVATSRCVTSPIGWYARNDTGVAPCSLPANLLPTTAAVGSGDSDANFSEWTSFVTPGAYNASQSCGFGVQRRILSRRFDQVLRAAPPGLMWCNRTEGTTDGSADAGTLSSLGIQAEIFYTLNPQDLLDLHVREGRTRLGFQLAEVFDVGGDGWSWYLITALDRMVPAPTNVSFQLWFNASFVTVREARTAPSPSSLFFSHNVTMTWTDLTARATSSSSKRWVLLSAGVSLDFTSGILAFAFNGTVLGPLRSVAWTASLATAPCVAATTNSQSSSGASYRVAIGGWHAVFTSPQTIVQTRLGASDTLPQRMAFFPANLTALTFAGVPFDGTQLFYSNPTSPSLGGGGPTPVARGGRFNATDGSAFPVALPNRTQGLSYLNTLALLFNQSNVTWDGFCRGGLVRGSASACVPCPAGAVWVPSSNVGGREPTCVCTSTREYTNGSCVVLRQAYAAPLVVDAASRSDSGSGIVVVLDAVRRERVLVAWFAMDPSKPHPADGFLANGSVVVVASCSRQLTQIVLETSSNRSVCSVYATITLGFGGGGDTCSLTGSVLQASRLPSAAVTRVYRFVPRAAPLQWFNLNVANLSTLGDATSNLTVVIRNYTFFSPAMSFYLIELAAAVTGADAADVSDATSLALVMNASRVQDAVDSAQLTVHVRYGSDPSPSSAPSAPSSSVDGSGVGSGSDQLYVSSLGYVVIPLMPATFIGSVVLLRLSISSSLGLFSDSNAVVVELQSESYGRRLLPEQPNPAADALSHPAVLTLSVLTLAVTSVLLSWTFWRRPDGGGGALTHGNVSSTTASSSASSSCESDDDDDNVVQHQSVGCATATTSAASPSGGDGADADAGGHNCSPLDRSESPLRRDLHNHKRKEGSTKSSGHHADPTEIPDASFDRGAGSRRPRQSLAKHKISTTSEDAAMPRGGAGVGGPVLPPESSGSIEVELTLSARRRWREQLEATANAPHRSIGQTIAGDDPSSSTTQRVGMPAKPQPSSRGTAPSSRGPLTVQQPHSATGPVASSSSLRQPWHQSVEPKRRPWKEAAPLPPPQS